MITIGVPVGIALLDFASLAVALTLLLSEHGIVVQQPSITVAEHPGI